MRIATDRKVVLVREMVSPAGLGAAFDGRNPAWEHEHYVLPKSRKLLGLPAPEAFPQTDKEKQGSNTPGDAEHREEGAKLVSPEGGQGLADDLNQHSHWSGSAEILGVWATAAISC